MFSGLDTLWNLLDAVLVFFIPSISYEVLSHAEKTNVEVISAPKSDTAISNKLTKISVVINQNQFEPLKSALDSIGINGMTVTHVLGYGMQKGKREFYRGVALDTTLLPKVKIVVCNVPVSLVIKTIKSILYTGNVGDGKTFVYDVENVIKVRTVEEGYLALKDEY